LRIKHY